MQVLSTMACSSVEDFEHNLVGIQPYLTARDYASGRSLKEKLAVYFHEADRRGLLRSSTIVVLPEMIGAWLIICDEPVLPRRVSSLSLAMAALAARRPLRCIEALLRSNGRDRVKEALFRMKAGEIAATYQDVFSSLASRFGVTLVAGSLFLPKPSVKGGCLVAGEGDLRNVSVVYRPDGSAHEELVVKVHPVAEEMTFVKGGSVQALPVFDTPACRLGVLVCADSWYPSCYEELARKGADVLAVPACLMPKGAWTRAWSGYSGAVAPQDVAFSDVKSLTEREAWLKYAMPGRLSRTGMKVGVTAFLRGSVFDIGFDGTSLTVAGSDLTVAADESGPAMVNVGWRCER